MFAQVTTLDVEKTSQGGFFLNKHIIKTWWKLPDSEKVINIKDFWNTEVHYYFMDLQNHSTAYRRIVTLR